jgi:hypothetical protein
MKAAIEVSSRSQQRKSEERVIRGKH